MDGAERGKSRDCGSDALQISRNAGIAAGARGTTLAISVCSGIFEFSRDSGTAGRAWQTAPDAGFDVLRWARICASASDGARYASWDRGGPPNERGRKGHFDRHT